MVNVCYEHLHSAAAQCIGPYEYTQHTNERSLISLTIKQLLLHRAAGTIPVAGKVEH